MIGQKRTQDYRKTKECVRNHFIRNYEMFGVTKYSIQDDTFNDSLEKVQYFADVIESLPFKIYFWCYLRAEMIVKHPEMIKLLHDMGLAHTWMGIDTYTQKTGKTIGKAMDPERLRDMLYQAKSVWGTDVLLQQGYIVGLPYESIDDLNKSREWLTRPDCPVDETLFQGLFLRSNRFQEVLQPSEYSVFDTNYEKYGYYFPRENEMHNVNDMMFGISWVKDDDTGIGTYQKACEVAADFNKDCWNKWRLPQLETTCLDNTPCGSHDLLWPDILKQGHYYVIADEMEYKQHIKEHYINPFLAYK